MEIMEVQSMIRIKATSIILEIRSVHRRFFRWDWVVIYLFRAWYYSGVRLAGSVLYE